MAPEPRKWLQVAVRIVVVWIGDSGLPWVTHSGCYRKGSAHCPGKLHIFPGYLIAVVLPSHLRQ